MGQRFPEQIFGHCFFVTTTFKDWRRFGDTTGVYEVLADSLRFYITKYDARLPAYVLMPSHIHLLLVLDGSRLSGFMRDFKKFVSQKSIKDVGITDGAVWMLGYDRVVVTSEPVFITKVEYIHENPVKAELVRTSTDWVWSSAVDYKTDKSGPIPVWKDWHW